MTQTEIVERFFSMERKLRELSGELIAKGMTVEEIKKATEKDIKDFSDFAYNNSDAIYNAIKENLIEQLKNDAIKPIDALFIYLMVTNFTPINSLQSDQLSRSVTKINDQVLANSAKSSKDLQEPASEELEKEIESMWAKEDKYQDTDYKIAELSKEDYANVARHFAQWQREQMMNGAVEGCVARDKNLGLFLYKEEPTLNKRFGGFWQGERSFCLPRRMFPNLKWDDKPLKVKLIILKDNGI